MKFLIVTCIKECRNDVLTIFRKSNIHVFSITDVVGIKDNQAPNLLEEWFASGDEQFDSQMIFSFTSEENAVNAMSLIDQQNENKPTQFPLRAFILPVEATSK
jgi:hypothetical protein